MGLFSKWRSLLDPGHLADKETVEEHRKRIYVLFGFVLTVPVLIGYGSVYLLDGDKLFDVFLNFALAAIFLVIAILLRTKADGLSLYRFGMAGLAILLAYNAGFGPYGESEALWLLVYPLAAFYIFGAREGLFWIAALMIPSGVFIFFPGPFNAYSYPVHFRIALVIAVVLSILLSYLLESLRSHFYLRLEKRSIELHEALADVRELKGLLPICATCKSIRDDEGYWQAVEHYLATHTNVTFTHGICESCLKKEEPEVYEELVKQGKIRDVEADDE